MIAGLLITLLRSGRRNGGKEGAGAIIFPFPFSTRISRLPFSPPRSILAAAGYSLDCLVFFFATAPQRGSKYTQ